MLLYWNLNLFVIADKRSIVNFSQKLLVTNNFEQQIATLMTSYLRKSSRLLNLRLTTVRSLCAMEALS